MRRFVTIATVALVAIGVLAADKPKDDKKPPADQPASVSIKNMAFSPATVNVKAGGTVTWTNNDDRDHSVVASDNSFKSGNISAGATYERKFTRAGKFAYTCGYHPRMRGTVVVLAVDDTGAKK